MVQVLAFQGMKMADLTRSAAYSMTNEPNIASIPSRTEQLVRIICADIGKGVFKVGTQIPIESELCSRYQVSRTVLRETMARLKADGIIDVQQGRGSFVLRHSLRTPFRFDPRRASSVQGIIELAELRLGVEGMAAALAARRRTSKQLRQLKLCLAPMDQATRDIARGRDADVKFHRTIAEAAGNDYYRAFMDYLWQSYELAIEAARANSARSPILSEQAQQEHEAIYRAIADENPSLAEDAAKQHIRNAVKRLLGEDSTSARLWLEKGPK